MRRIVLKLAATSAFVGGALTLAALPATAADRDWGAGEGDGTGSVRITDDVR
ncbi:hypothetical protein [Nonomuraea lactucae]|uniref:hypothetical protein n=1 Tax=Nonomuraea lactucae TaxID=2249762 RepID=UPI0013B477B5|nr:hypothetical protein [Nonomuraea lactucae]